MKTTRPICLTFLLAAALLPGLAFAAKDDKPQKKRTKEAATATGGQGLAAYDKNGNKQIDADELAAMQKTFAELRQFDKNANGEIEQGEVQPPKAATNDRKDRAMGALTKADKNANGKIDTDEAEAIQKVLSGSRIMEKLDQNGNGKLESNELERLNNRLSQSGSNRKSQSVGSKPTPAPTKSEPEKTPEVKKAEPKKDEPKKEESKDLSKDPFLPKTDAKPAGNFGN